MLQDDAPAFSRRLQQALKRSLGRVLTATELATQFNLRHTLDPITPQAAQKWLNGKACPTPEKCETLADWLSVPVHWLRFGPPEPMRKKSAGKVRQSTTQARVAADLSTDERKLVAYYRTLSERRRQLILDLLDDSALEREMLATGQEE